MKRPCRPPDARRLLKKGDVLVRTLLHGRSEYRLGQADLVVAPDDVAKLLNRTFLGGRLWPERDGLPGFEDGGSQSWRWRKNPPRVPVAVSPEPAVVRP